MHPGMCLGVCVCRTVNVTINSCNSIAPSPGKSDYCTRVRVRMRMYLGVV